MLPPADAQLFGEPAKIAQSPVESICDFLESANAETLHTLVMQEVLSCVNNPRFNPDDPDQLATYQYLLKLATADLGFSPEANLEEVQDDRMVYDAIAKAIGLDPTELHKAGRDDFVEWGNTLSTYIRNQNSRVPLFLGNFLHLAPNIQMGLRRMISDIQGHVKIVALDNTAEDLYPARWITSPLSNIFTSGDLYLATERPFDPVRGSHVIAAFRQSFTELKSSNFARLHLPSRTGKTTFARLIVRMNPDKAGYQSYEYLVVNGILNLDAIHVNPDKVLILDEAQALTQEQREQLEFVFPKILYLENDLGS